MRSESHMLHQRLEEPERRARTQVLHMRVMPGLVLAVVLAAAGFSNDAEAAALLRSAT